MDAVMSAEQTLSGAWETDLGQDAPKDELDQLIEPRMDWGGLC